MRVDLPFGGYVLLKFLDHIQLLNYIIYILCHKYYYFVFFFAGPYAVPDARQPRAPGHDGGHPRPVRPAPHDQEDAHQVLQHQQQQARLG